MYYPVHVHLNKHGWHSSFTQVVYTLFPKLRAFVESDVACSYETFMRKKRAHARQIPSACAST